VRVAPDEIKIIEFIRGTPIGLNVLILVGGQVSPNSTLGEILEWKKAQNNLTKNIISDTMNITMLFFLIDLQL